MNTNITESLYEMALQRIEELLPEVCEDTPTYNAKAVELKLMSDIVIEYEEKHFPVNPVPLTTLMKNKMKEKHLTQKELAKRLEISTSRVNDYLQGKCEPTLKMARAICQVLDIEADTMLGL